MFSIGDFAGHGRVPVRMIENEGTMSSIDVTIKPLPALRLAELSGTARSMEPPSIGPVVHGLFADLCAALDRGRRVPYSGTQP